MTPAYRDAQAKRAARKARRQANRGFQVAVNEARTGVKLPATASGAVKGPLTPRTPVRKPGKRFKTGKIGRLASRSTLKAQIIRLLGLRDRKLNGPMCRLGDECPTKTPHHGTLAYHVVPAQRGDSTRFVPSNVVWACSAANYGEVMNRSLYRDKHCRVFGTAMIEELEAQARQVKKYTRDELVYMRDSLRAELEATA